MIYTSSSIFVVQVWHMSSKMQDSLAYVVDSLLILSHICRFAALIYKLWPILASESTNPEKQLGFPVNN